MPSSWLMFFSCSVCRIFFDFDLLLLFFTPSNIGRRADEDDGADLFLSLLFFIVVLDMLFFC